MLLKGREQPEVSLGQKISQFPLCDPQTSVREPFPGMALLQGWIGAKDNAAPSGQNRCQGEGKSWVNALKIHPWATPSWAGLRDLLNKSWGDGTRKHHVDFSPVSLSKPFLDPCKHQQHHPAKGFHNLA